MPDALPRWPHGARAAIALSYDDALPSHLDLVVPALAARELRATFYITVGRPDFLRRLPEWRAVATAGHELGNHTIFHPCRGAVGTVPVYPHLANDLRQYGPDRFRTELTVANYVLHTVDGQTERTYGGTCHNVTLGPDDQPQRIEPILRELFVAGRGECRNQVTDPLTADLANLGTTRGDGAGFPAWQAVVDATLAAGGFTLFTFHGVADSLMRLHVAAADHAQLLDYLRARRAEVWTAPVVEVARWLRDHHQRPTTAP
jgi:peptidoglycan/xylan/chitin deacetylase (PgdA/CDA1 family)